MPYLSLLRPCLHPVDLYNQGYVDQRTVSQYGERSSLLWVKRARLSFVGASEEYTEEALLVYTAGDNTFKVL